MNEIQYRSRRAFALENEHLEIVVTVEGGHIAAIRDKSTGINPLWSPPWASIEPSTYDPALHPEYGGNSESRLLAGIMGHNLCLDLFGGPSAEEAAAGMSVHGEASVNPYEIRVAGDTLTARTVLRQAGLAFERSIRLSGRRAAIHETVENLTACDRPVAWTQHVTFGPPFLERGKTQFRASATRSKSIGAGFSHGAYMRADAEFDWPLAPCSDGSLYDMRVMTLRETSAAFSTHLMDPRRPQAYFMAWSPSAHLALAYVWKQADFPWLGIWEENYDRTAPPWRGQTLTRGLEFGASPFPESRRSMIERGSLFGTPGYRWIPARSRVSVDYVALLVPAASVEDVVL